MATPKPHVYKVSRTHPVASKLKPGEEMTTRMKMMPLADDAGEDGDYAMEEQEVAPYKAPPKLKGKPKTPAEALKQKREMT